MDLTTTYLGLQLKSPIVVGSSTLTGTVNGVKQCADAGAGAVVLKSLFEEQILADIQKETSLSDAYETCPEMLEYAVTHFRGSEIGHYTNLIREAKKAVDIPVIASINCTTKGEWTSIAKDFEAAGADALELNLSLASFDPTVDGKSLEDELIDIVKTVKSSISIPVAVKIGSHFTNIHNIAFRIAKAGADGLVLFNRFYNPDIDINQLKTISGAAFSVPEELSHTLRWTSLLYGCQIPCNLSASTGVHESKDVIKLLLGGATTVQLCSTLYKNGLESIGKILTELQKWMEEHHFNNLKDFRGKVTSNENVKMMERLQYLERNNQ